MDMQGSIGGLIPFWILGAPLVTGLIAWMTAPKTSTRHDGDTGSAYAYGTATHPGSG